MSADNWTTCPRCRQLQEAASASRVAEIDSLYGHVPASEFIRRREELIKPIVLDETLREYYEIGIHNGKFYVDYSAACEKCLYKFDYKHEETTDGF